MKTREKLIAELEYQVSNLETMLCFLNKAEHKDDGFENNRDTLSKHLSTYFNTINELKSTVKEIEESYGEETIGEFITNQN